MASHIASSRVSPNRMRSLGGTRPMCPAPMSPAASFADARKPVLASRRVLESPPHDQPPPDSSASIRAVRLKNSLQMRAFSPGSNIEALAATPVVAATAPVLPPPPPPGMSHREFTIQRSSLHERMGLSFEDPLCDTRVTAVFPGPCKAAGLEAGMIVTAVDGEHLTTLAQLQDAVARVGHACTIEVFDPSSPPPPQASRAPVAAAAAAAAAPGGELRSLDPQTPTAARRRKPLSYGDALAIANTISSAGEAVSAATPATPVMPLSALKSHTPAVWSGSAAEQGGAWTGGETPRAAAAAAVDFAAVGGGGGSSEVQQLRVQLEAANAQVKSAVSRTALAADRERELMDDLVAEKQSRRALEQELAAEIALRRDLEQDVQVLVRGANDQASAQHALSVRRCDEAASSAAVAALEDELARLRCEHEAVLIQQAREADQATYNESDTAFKYKELLRQHESDRVEWECQRRDLRSQLAAAQRKAAEADAMKAQLEALTASLNEAPPLVVPGRRGLSASPTMHSPHVAPSPPPPPPAAFVPTPSATYISTTPRGGPTYSRTVTPAEHPPAAVPPPAAAASPPPAAARKAPRSASVGESLLLSNRLNDDPPLVGLAAASEKAAAAAPAGPPPKAGEPSAGESSGLDDRLEVLARRAKEAIKSAEQRASSAEDQAAETREERRRLEARVRQLESERAARSAERRERAAEAEAEAEAARQLSRDDERRRRQREREARLAAAPSIAAAAAAEEEKERKARLSEERSEPRSGRASPSPSPATTVPPPAAAEPSTAFETKAEAERVFDELLARSEVQGGVHVGALPEMLQCGPTWKALFRGLDGDEGQIVRRAEWLAWVRDLERTRSRKEAEARLTWVLDQLELYPATEARGGTPFGGQTTRELAAEAKYAERQEKAKKRDKSPASKYEDWGSPASSK